MSDKQAAISLANKLLRLAAPSSKTTDPERISAALEAARVVEENNLTVAEKIEPKRIPRQQPSEHVDWIARAETTRTASDTVRPAHDQDGFFARTKSRRRTNQSWDEIFIGKPTTCVVCGRTIHAGEKAWVDQAIGWRHYEIDCDQK